MFGLYITHPQVQIDPAVPVPDWGLSAVGRARAAACAERPWVRQLSRIVSSRERKAVETAEILGNAAGVDVEAHEALHENDRSATGFLAPADFERAADWFFAHPQDSYRGWERAVDAQARIVSAVDGLLATHDATKPIAFVGHGAVGTLLKCHFSSIPISRVQDQAGGGGNLFCFSLADRRISCDWTPMEIWQEFYT